MTEDKPKPPPRMTNESLKKFVLGFCDGRIFTNLHIRNLDSRLLRLVFLPFALADATHVDPDKLGLVWEWKSEATPRAINGYPTFISARLMHEEDWKIAEKAIRKEMKRRENIEIGD